MNVVFLYGPPAVGKLTIATTLQKKLEYKLLHNHQLISLFDTLFDFHNPSRRILTREFRMRIVEEAIKQDMNLIITSGSAGSPTLFEYYDELLERVTKLGGHLAMVQLIADPEILLSRVDDEFRRMHDKNFGKEELKQTLAQPHFVFDKYPNVDHPTINTGKVTPEEAADQIIKHYNLS